MNYLANPEFNDLQKQLDDEELIDFMTLLGDEMSKRCLLLSQSMDERDLKKITEIAHKLAGTFGIIGISKLRLLALEIENKAIAGRLDYFLLRSLLAEIGFLIEEINQLRTR